MNLFKQWNNLKLSLLAVFLLLLCLFAVGQVITFAWLSNFPERAQQLGELKIKYWSWSAIALITAITELMIIIQLVQRFLNSRKEKNLR